MATLFYDHLIDWGKLDQALNALELDKNTYIEYWEHIEHVLHTEVVMVLINHLPEERHEEFLDRFHATPHDNQHLHYLASHGKGDVEMGIRIRSDELINELLKDLEN